LSEILTHRLNLDTSSDSAVNGFSSLLIYLYIYLQENTHQAFTHWRGKKKKQPTPWILQVNCEWHETWGTPNGIGQQAESPPSPSTLMVTAGPSGRHSRHTKKWKYWMLYAFFQRIFSFLPTAYVLKNELHRAAAPKDPSSPPGVPVTHLGKISAHT